MPPFETIIIPTSTGNFAELDEKIKTPKEFAQEITGSYEEIARQGGHVIACFVVDKLHTSANLKTDQAIIVAEMPEAPVNR